LSPEVLTFILGMVAVPLLVLIELRCECSGRWGCRSARIEAANQRHAARRALGVPKPRSRGIPTHESLTTEIIKFPPRAVSQDWKAVTVADVTEMLRQARVREPWHAPDLGCFSLAQCINNPLGYRSVYTTRTTISKKRAGHDCGVIEGKPARTKADRARETIDQLRRVLTAAIAEFESSVTQAFRVYSSSPLSTEHLREIQGLPQAIERCEIFKQVLVLLNSLPPRPRQRARAWWRLDAAKLWHIYRATIDVSAGISPGGPAVRFIRAALVRMGYRRLPKHIESALRDPINWRDEYLRRRFDEVMI